MTNLVQWRVPGFSEREREYHLRANKERTIANESNRAMHVCFSAALFAIL